MKNPVGADWDNTYDKHPEIHDEVKFIATGNNFDKYDDAKDEGINIPIFWNPGKEEFMDIVEHKANIINKTGASKFYEDQKMQVALLRTLCPNAKIVQVKDIEEAT